MNKNTIIKLLKKAGEHKAAGIVEAAGKKPPKWGRDTRGKIEETVSRYGAAVVKPAKGGRYRVTHFAALESLRANAKKARAAKK